MSAYSRPSPRALFRDRRVQIGGTVALSVAALMGAGAIAVLASTRADATSPDVADHARLMIVSQSAPKPSLSMSGEKLATLDVQQSDASPPDTRQAAPMDPDLQALLASDRQREREAAAEQRAFDARINAELHDTPRTPEEPPAPRGGWTSNSEDAGDTAPS